MVLEIILRLEEDEAWALAELARRFTRGAAARFSDRQAGGVEREAMLTAVRTLGRSLAEAGISGRRI